MTNVIPMSSRRGGGTTLLPKTCRRSSTSYSSRAIGLRCKRPSNKPSQSKGRR